MSLNKKNRKRLYVDMDGTLAFWIKACSVEDCFAKGYFKDLPPQENIVKLINNFVEKHKDTVEVYVLSAVLDTPYAIPEKTEWLKKYVPAINENNYIFVPYGQDKFKFIDDLDRDCYLFDDYTVNLLAWHKAGGTAIKCRSYCNHTNKTWNGPYIHTGFPLMIMEEIFEDIIFEGKRGF